MDFKKDTWMASRNVRNAGLCEREVMKLPQA